MNSNIYAAIAMATYEYAGNNVHDVEPGITTIKAKADNVECQVRDYDKETIRQMKEFKYND